LIAGLNVRRVRPMAMPLHPFELFSTRDELCRQLVHLTDREGRPVCAEGFLSDEDFQQKVETRGAAGITR
jgi:hypothetical protein